MINSAIQEYNQQHQCPTALSQSCQGFALYATSCVVCVSFKALCKRRCFTILGKLFLGNFSSRFITVFLNLQPTLLKHVCIILFVTDSPVANYKIFCQQALWFRWSYWKWWCLFLDFMFNNRIFTVGLCYASLVNFFMAWLTKLTVPI